jgi:hypothetical protein
MKWTVEVLFWFETRSELPRLTDENDREVRVRKSVHEFVAQSFT